MTIRRLLAIALAAAVATPHSASAAPECSGSTCQIRVTPQQLLASAEQLVQSQRFDEARALLAALRLAPGYALQTRFLTGYIASLQGDFRTAATQYKAILADDPGQTRVRLELGKAMMALGQAAAADRQLRLAQQSRELDPQLSQLVRGARDIIRSSRSFRADISVGIAPDSNINNATSARTVDVHFGDVVLPLSLSDDARARSGTGQTANLSTASRLPVGGDTFLLANVDATGTNYAGSRFDDYQGLVALGAERQVSDNASLSFQAVGTQRWYADTLVSRQIGARGGVQMALGERDRIGIQLDARRTRAFFDPAYDGWQGGLYATYETGLGRSFFASGGPFLRRDWLREKAYSNVELGASAAVAGELPLGMNIGMTGSFSRAMFGAPVQLFSPAARKDWRLFARATLGNRKLRVAGFSPQISWQATAIGSSVGFYRSERSRFAFELARYF